MNVVVLPLQLRDRLVAWSTERSPREASGILVGTGTQARFEVAHACLCENRSAAGDSFELDPGAIVRTAAEARARGFDIVGFWHSHASGPAVPSSRDAEYATWPGLVCAIVSPAASPAVRAWCTPDGAFVEAVLLTEPSGNAWRVVHNVRIRQLDGTPQS